MAKYKLEDLTRDPQVLALAQADDWQLVNECLAAGFLAISLTVLQGWRQEGRIPPAFVLPTPSTVRYPVGELRRFSQMELEKAMARVLGSAPTEPEPNPCEDLVQETVPAGMNLKPMKGGRRKGIKHGSFSQFMTNGMADDEWVFALIPDASGGAVRRPVDLIETLTMPEAEIADATCEQLTMTAYLERLAAYFAAKPFQDEAHRRAGQAAAFAPPPNSTRNKRGDHRS